MRFARTLGATIVAGVFVVGLVLDAHRPVRGATDLKTSQATINRPAADITDTYLFPSPNNSNNVVVVMDVYPNIPAGSSVYFDQGVLYQMKFDTKWASEAVGSRPVPDQVIQFSMTAPGNGTQGIYVYGPTAPNETGTANTPVTQTGFGQFGKSFALSNGMTVFAGLRADPSYFAYNQFLQIFPNRNAGSTAQSCLPSGTDTCPNGFGSSGTDAFAGTDVLSIAVEVPKALLIPSGTGPQLAYWATTNSTTGN